MVTVITAYQTEQACEACASVHSTQITRQCTEQYPYTAHATVYAAIGSCAAALCVQYIDHTQQRQQTTKQ
eukprot:10821-Heterococcus_DN1.PRE.11